MSTSEGYTPLEMLMLCQELNPSEPNPPSFVKISESLKNNDLLREGESYDPARLDPDALTQLYLLLIKEEARNEVQRVGNAQDDKDGEHNTHQTMSPSLENVDEAPWHRHLLPSLLNRLYFRYRNHAIKEIESEECKYRSLQRDIQEINRGEWDARLQLEGISSGRDVKEAVTSIQALLTNKSDTEISPDETSQHLADSPARNGDEASVQANKEPEVPQDSPIEITSSSVEMPKERSDQGKPMNLDAVEQQSPPLPPEGPDSETLNHSPHPQVPSPTEPQQCSGTQDTNASPQATPSETKIPFMPARQPQDSGLSLPSPDVNQRIPFPSSQSQATAAPAPSPRLQQLSSPPKDRSPQSPITLPPLAGVLRSTVSPLGPLDTLADMAGQQPYRPSPTLPSPRTGQLPAGQSHSIQLPTPRNYQYSVYPYYDSQQSYGAPYPYGRGAIPPYQQAKQPVMSPYQGSASSPGRVPVYGNVPLYQSPTPSYSQYSQYPQSSSYTQTPLQSQFNRNPAPPLFDPHTPLPRPSGRSRPPRPSINTSTTSTRWKNVETPGSIRSPRSPIRPRPEEISPVSAESPSPGPETFQLQHIQLDSQSSNRGRGVGSSRRGLSRGRGTRAASTASTVAVSAQARTRSQSFHSHPEDLQPNNTPSQHDNIRTESAATPGCEEESPITEATADEGSRQSSRRRRGTLRSVESTEFDTLGKKRKRTRQESLVRFSSPSASNLNRPNHILGSRNFPRTSATIMNDISAHKLASMFAKPLTERDAPGYKNLIYRPQDLKSIKSAIAAGGRALVSAADGAGAAEPGSPAGQVGGVTPINTKSSAVWIPATADLVPPKGIVNSAQLEKELMRMFANAVMFNPDPKRGFGSTFRERNRSAGGESREDDDRSDEEEEEGPPEDYEEGGVVKDTREIYAAVERSVTDWRAAERAVELGGVLGGTIMKGPVGRLRGKEENGEGNEVDGEEGQGNDEDDTSVVKRRRR